jgi:type IV pilus assembly protein PilC
MPTFEYSGMDRLGRLTTGEVSAETSQDAVMRLRDQSLFVIKLREKSRMVSAAGILEAGRYFPNRLRASELVGFTQQLSTLIRAGVPLLECLDLLGSEASNPRLRQVLPVIRDKVASGHYLAQALEAYPDIFPNLYRHLVEVGESTGRLDESLAQLGVYLDKQTRLRSKILTSMAYPGLLVAVTMGVLVFLFVWVVPMFAGLFQEMGESLPWLTVVVIGMAEGVRTHWFWLIGAWILLMWGIRRLKQEAGIQERCDGAVLKVPLIGPTLRKAEVVRLTRTLGSLVQRGVPLLQALSVAGGVVGNKMLESGIRRATVHVENGVPLSEALRVQGLFPSMMTQMIRVGESTGSLDRMLDKIADLYEEEVDRAVATITVLIEPAIIVVVGGAIAVVVIAMYLPIFSIGSVIG